MINNNSENQVTPLVMWQKKFKAPRNNTLYLEIFSDLIFQFQSSVSVHIFCFISKMSDFERISK